MSGQEVLVELQRLDPAVKVMVFSGYAPAADKIYGQVMAVAAREVPQTGAGDYRRQAGLGPRRCRGFGAIIGRVNPSRDLARS